MIQKKIYDGTEVQLISDQPLTLLQLSLLADEIRNDLCVYRPEFANLVHLQRKIGCRVQELFNAERWRIVSNSVLMLTPQKKNNVRVLQLADIGFTDANDFRVTLADIGRLPNRQYERALSQIIREKNLWRLYEDGFSHPSTHLFRHVKIKELFALGFDKSYIATWIGEKNADNLDYYLNSQYYV